MADVVERKRSQHGLIRTIKELIQRRAVWHWRSGKARPGRELAAAVHGGGRAGAGTA
jgi:hypothetical protein